MTFTAWGGEVLQPPEDGILTDAVRSRAMPDTGDSRIGRILARYYNKGLGGPEAWESIISMRSRGVIQLEAGESLEIEALQRKPDRMKVVIRQDGRESLILAHDGQTAWRLVAGDARATSLEGTEARRFIHSSGFGSHLLYPYARGKKIEYIETIPVAQKVCHKLRVHLETGYQVDYYIDVSDYHEFMVDNLDLQSGMVNTVRYGDYTVVSGMPMAMRVENLEDGKLVSVLELDDFQVNIGIMPWMFEMPAPDPASQPPAATAAP